ncbi:GNAT family N-acetyltransferase [Rhodococcus sp. NPDC058639]|uniref:GNAT family N-acetyltransferase n=1 Tax=Rhodococcus sp. NPDC058639 TaxID=3346570 RepID=UPI00365071EB
MRPPRFSDFQRWRRIRLRDREFIERFWASSPVPWEQRHTEEWWIRECLHLRRASHSLGFAIEVDGLFSGQCTLTDLDPDARSAEMGIWMDSALGGMRVGSLALAMVADHAFGALGLHRITAPISCDNEPAARAVRRAGLVHEATMRAYFDVGGCPKDHALWAVTADTAPPGGFVVTLSIPGMPPRGRPRPVSDRLPSVVAIVTTARFFAGSVKGRVLSHLSSGRQESVAGRLDDDSTFVLTPLSPREAQHHRNGQLSPRGRSLARRGCGNGLQPADLRAGRALAFRVVSGGIALGHVALEGLDAVRGNAVLRVESETYEPHTALVSATTTLMLHGFRDLGLRRIQTEIDPDDPLATSFAAAAGLEFEGRMSGIRTETGSFGVRELWAAVADTAAPAAVTHTAGAEPGDVKAQDILPTPYGTGTTEGSCDDGKSGVTRGRDHLRG